jgi:hypothetical protein
MWNMNVGLPFIHAVVSLSQNLGGDHRCKVSLLGAGFCGRKLLMIRVQG